MSLLLLIRHALTESTGKRLTGWTPGIHLSPKGEEQAELLAERLSGFPLQAVYSSPLERCRETARPVAVRAGLKITPRADVGEIRFGDWTGRSLSQLRRTKLWSEVQTTPSRARFPEGESVLEVQGRAVRECERIAAAHPAGAVAIFSHADVIKLVVAWFSGTHTDLFQRLVVSPASVSAVVLGRGGPAILRVNDTGELRELAPGGRGSGRGRGNAKVRG